MTVNQQEWLEALARFRDEGRSCCQVVVTGVKGSAPREVGGARMIVADGKLAWGHHRRREAGAPRHSASLRAARGRTGGDGDRVRAALGEGGPVLWGRGQPLPGVILLDTGVGWSFSAAATSPRPSPASRTTWTSTCSSSTRARPRRWSRRWPESPPYEVLFIDAPEEEVDSIPADSLLLVMTHSHSIDQDVIARALRRGSFPYIGLIGSDRKWARFKQRLEQRGATADELASGHPARSGSRRDRRSRARSPSPWRRRSWRSRSGWPRRAGAELADHGFSSISRGSRRRGAARPRDRRAPPGGESGAAPVPARAAAAPRARRGLAGADRGGVLLAQPHGAGPPGRCGRGVVARGRDRRRGARG